MKILILEDDIERITQFVSQIYKQWPEEASITVANKADIAIEDLKNNKYDMILLDHDLGGQQMIYDEFNCGTVVANWLEQNPVDSKVIIHSLNLPASKRMLMAISGSVHVPFLWTPEQFQKHIIGYKISEVDSES